MLCVHVFKLVLLFMCVLRHIHMRAGLKVKVLLIQAI